MQNLRRFILTAFLSVGLLDGLEKLRGDTLPPWFATTDIPDNVLEGVTLTFSPAPAFANLDRISLTLSHEWLGDLTIKVLPPNGPAITLVDRPGVSEAEPDGSAALFGDFEFNSIGVGILTPRKYVFARTGEDLLAVAQNAVDTQPAPVVPFDKTYAAQSWTDGPFQAGTWQILLADSAELSNGKILTAEIDYSIAVVPEPGNITLGIIGGLLLGMIRRKR